MGKITKLSDEEKNYIKNSYLNNISISEIAKHINRSSDSVRRYLQKENIFIDRINHMSGEELSSLIDDYNRGMTPKELSEKYKRSSGYVINKLKRVGVYVDSRINNISNDDMEKLITYYKDGDWEEINKMFPYSSKESIYARMNSIGISQDSFHWKENDLEFLKENIELYTYDELYNIFNKRYSKNAIRTKANRLKLTNSKKWSQEELNILIDNYSIIEIDEICKLIPNRTRKTIINKACELGIKSKSTIETHWSNEEIDYLINNYKYHTDAYIGSKIGKDEISVNSKRRWLNLSKENVEIFKYSYLIDKCRKSLYYWRNESIINCNNECVITGSKDFDVHHLYSFNKIFKEFIDTYSIEYQDFSILSKEEINDLINKFLVVHNKYPLGVCIDKKLHDKFHFIYGFDNTPEQFEEFKKDYKLLTA